ncbi:MAG: hypothetical protein GY804_07795 [Alphaproteobacteria bacterium]|nr:hypothetical protein [Alphaproteobacteria bacterium]
MADNKKSNVGLFSRVVLGAATAATVVLLCGNGATYADKLVNDAKGQKSPSLQKALVVDGATSQDSVAGSPEGGASGNDPEEPDVSYENGLKVDDWGNGFIEYTNDAGDKLSVSAMGGEDVFVDVSFCADLPGGKNPNDKGYDGVGVAYRLYVTDDCSYKEHLCKGSIDLKYLETSQDEEDRVFHRYDLSAEEKGAIQPLADFVAKSFKEGKKMTQALHKTIVGAVKGGFAPDSAKQELGGRICFNGQMEPVYEQAPDNNASDKAWETYGDIRNKAIDAANKHCR